MASGVSADGSHRLRVRLEGLVRSVSRQFKWVSAISVIAMAGLLCVNILTRLVYQAIVGVYEVVGILGAIAITFTVASTQLEGGHTRLDILLERVSQRSRAIIDSITSAVLLALSAIIVWQSVTYALYVWRSGYLTDTLRMPLYIFMLMLPLGFSLLCLVFLVQFVNLLTQAVVRK